MPTNDKRREVAERLRQLPIDMHEVEERWETEGIGTVCNDQTDYHLIHLALFGCLPADHMHPCDYEELHHRLADLIEPSDETCEADLTDVEELLGTVRVFECSKCGMSWDSVCAYDYSYCPYCGRRIENADE